MSSIIPFNFKNYNLRVILDDNGNPLFIAKDVAVALGYKHAPGAVVKHCKKAKPLKDIGSPFQPPQLPPCRVIAIPHARQEPYQSHLTIQV